MLVLSIVLKFCLFVLFSLWVGLIFFPLISLFFPSVLCGLWRLRAPAISQAWTSKMGDKSLGHWLIREHLIPWNTNQQKCSQKASISTLRCDPIQSSKLLCCTAHTKTTRKTETQPYPLADRLPKVIPSSQAYHNTPMGVTLPYRETWSSSTHENIGASPLH